MAKGARKTAGSGLEQAAGPERIPLQDNLAALLEERGITPAGLSKQIGRDPAYVRDIVNPKASKKGPPNPGILSVIAICKALEVSIDELVGLSLPSREPRSEGLGREEKRIYESVSSVMRSSLDSGLLELTPEEIHDYARAIAVMAVTLAGASEADRRAHLEQTRLNLQRFRVIKGV